MARRSKNSVRTHSDLQLADIQIGDSDPGRLHKSVTMPPVPVKGDSDVDTPVAETPFSNVDFSAVFGDDRSSGNDSQKSMNPELQLDLMKTPSLTHREKKTPDQDITLFALRMAIIEKGASGLGTLAFLWATVVLLGGFASSASSTDFLVISVILITESTRVFSRSHELEWKHADSESSDSLAGRLLRMGPSLWKRSMQFRSADRVHSDSTHGSKSDVENGARLKVAMKSRDASHTRHSQAPKSRDGSETTRTQKPVRAADKVHIIPYTWTLLPTNVVGNILYMAQIVSAMICVALSAWRLKTQEFYNSDDSAPANINVSMNLFYSLAILEAMFYLIERMCWEFAFRFGGFLRKVTRNGKFGPENEETVNQFLYEVYAQCLKGSVFDGLEMDLKTYSFQRLQSESISIQLAGARLLNTIVSDKGKPREKDEYAADALRKIGTSRGVLERFVEMLSWHSEQEQELLLEVSSIVCQLVRYNRNCSRILAIPGSIDALVSLLLHGINTTFHGHEDISPVAICLRLNGLGILKYLSKDHMNCMKIGEAKGLLSILANFIQVKDCTSFEVTHSRLKTYKKALQLLGSLASATNNSGNKLRPMIASIVSCVRNLRDILEYGDSQPELQRLAVEILTSLALDDAIRNTIGSTGGVIRSLHQLFFKGGSTVVQGSSRRDMEARRKTSKRAGEALTILALQNQKNCKRMLALKGGRGDDDFVSCMIQLLSGDEERACSASLILRSVYAYATETLRAEIATASPIVIKRTIEIEYNCKHYECSLGLASRVLLPLQKSAFDSLFSNYDKSELVKRLSKNLHHTPTTNRFPRIRRFSIELILVLIKDNNFLQEFISQDLESRLEEALDTTSELENFCIFSGMIGLTRHMVDMEDLITSALDNLRSHSRSSSTS